MNFINFTWESSNSFVTPICCIFSISWVSTVICIVSFLLHSLTLICYFFLISWDGCLTHILLTFLFLWCFPLGSGGKESTCNAGDLVLIPGLKRSPGEGNVYPSRILAWRSPWTGKPSILQSMGSQRVGHDWATNTKLLTLFFFCSM